MNKITDTLYVFIYLLKAYYPIILGTTTLILLAFIVDFIIYTKTNKSLWHKIINK